MGTQIKKEGQTIIVPEDPIIHYIEGDGIGIDITPVMIRVVDKPWKRHILVRRRLRGKRC